MAESDFAFFGASASQIKRGVTAGYTPPSGGSAFVFGFNSQSAGDLASGVYYNATNFAPLRDDSSPQNATGGSVSGALKRAISQAATGYSIALFMCLQGASAPTTEDTGYLLGLSDADPHNIILAKGAPSVGLDPDSSEITVLETSSETFSWDTWVHLRLDAIVNPNGDVVLKCYQNDLDTNAVTAPSWEAITGISDYIDDALGANTNSNPLAGGFAGWVFQSSQAYRRGVIDHFTCYRQI
jgi:hypothetical protein